MVPTGPPDAARRYASRARARSLVLASITDSSPTGRRTSWATSAFPGSSCSWRRERLHPDPVRGDDAVRRLHRLRGRVLAVRGRRWSASFANLVGSWIAYASATTAASTSSRGTRSSTSGRRTSQCADRWFEKHGDAAVFFSRMLPIVRTFISLPAGVARMPIVRFSVLTFLGAVPWNLMLRSSASSRRDDWEDWKDRLHYIDYAVAAMIVAGARLPRRPAPADAGARSAPSPPPMRPARALRARAAARAGRAAADLLLGPRRACCTAGDLDARAAQGVRGRAARRHRRAAARRCAEARAAVARRVADRVRRPRSSACCSSARSSSGSARRATIAARAARRRASRWPPPTAAPRPGPRDADDAGAGRRPRARRSRRPARWCPGVSRNGATLPPRARAGSRARDASALSRRRRCRSSPARRC